MKRWLRRLRGALGIGAIWGLVGTALGTIGGLVGSVLFGVPFLGAFVAFGLSSGLVGFLVGSGFAGLLTMIEGRRTLDALSARRVAGWGAIAGGAMAMTWAVISLGPLVGTAAQPLSRFILNVVGTGVLYGGVSAGLAAGTLALARPTPAELTRGPLLDHKELVGKRTDGPDNREDERTGQMLDRPGGSTTPQARTT